MSLKQFKNTNGQLIKLNINEKEQYYKKITIYSPKLNIKRWFLWSSFFYLIGSYFQLHYQEIRLMIFVISILILILLIKINSKVKQESLLVVASVGVQLTTTFMSGRTLSMFYNISEVKDVIINEAITMHRVVCYLCLLMRTCPSIHISKLVPLFTFTWPSLSCLKLIRKELRPYLDHQKHYLKNYDLSNYEIDKPETDNYEIDKREIDNYEIDKREGDNYDLDKREGDNYDLEDCSKPMISNGILVNS